MFERKIPGSIQILGARQNNLKNIDVEIPINRFTVVTGVSGSGKSSLAFDTLYAEGQRRYVESLSAYARQFLERINKPLVRDIVGVSPAIAIRQKNTARTPRSTVGTVTEIYDYLRLLYARLGTIVCHKCGREIRSDSIDGIVAKVLHLPEGTKIHVTFPFRDSHLDLGQANPDKIVSLDEMLKNILKKGFTRLIVTENSRPLLRKLPEYQPNCLEELQNAHLLIDRLVIGEKVRERLTDSLEICYGEGNGVAQIEVLASGSPPAYRKRLRFTERFECQYCNIPYRSPEPRLFSFNNPYGACPTCQGFGNTISLDPQLVIPNPSKTIREGPIDPFTKPRYRYFQRRLIDYAQEQNISLDRSFDTLPASVRHKIWDGDGPFPGVKGFFHSLERKKYKMHVRIFISRYRSYTLCPDCNGERLCQEARDVYLEGHRLTQLTAFSIPDLQTFFSQLRLRPTQQTVAGKVLTEIRQRIEFLLKVGLSYLTLDRLTSTLSVGEIQRIQLAASLSSSLVGTLYILDEPSIGLHPCDGHRLIEILKELRKLGNTIVVVEHDKEIIESADRVIDLGPGSGESGGEVIHNGDLTSLLSNRRSLTGKYLRQELEIAKPTFRRPVLGQHLTLNGARQHNLKNLTVQIPLGVFVCVTGVSGSGKSTLIRDVLYAGLKRLKGKWKEEVGECDSIEGSDQISETLMVDQSPIGRTPRSNPVTYIKAFDDIRRIFASLRQSHSRNLAPGDFSFNVPGGRCETCAGSGTIVVEMQFLADVELECEDCKGSRFKKKILELTYNGKNIAEVLEMTVKQALCCFKAHPRLVRKLKVLEEVGLGYLRLGQPATKLSGGEAQRIKLASYLSRKTSNHPLFIFDEPTTGLHFDDVSKLLRAFDRLIAKGASLVVIEHNLDVMKCADWIIDLGPKGGDRGGQIIGQGPPEVISQLENSYTGQYLRKVLYASSKLRDAKSRR